MVNAVVGRLIKSDDATVQSLIDPVGKFRVSNPMNLIDTDFEYGLQTTRWQDLELVNNIPTFFARDNDEALDVLSVEIYEGSTSVLVTTSTDHGLSIGTPIFVQGVNSYSAEGGFVVATVPSTTSFFYKANSEQTRNEDIFDSYSTYVWRAQFYQGTAYSLDTLGSIVTDNGFPTSKITVDTIHPHGFTENSAFVLARSVGTKALAFDAGAVDIRETVTSSITFGAEDSIGAGVGLLDRPVVPYDWIGNKTVYVSLSDIGTASANVVTAEAHRLSGDVLYVCPQGDTPINGLVSNRLYSVQSSNPDSFELTVPQVETAQAFSNYTTYNSTYGSNTTFILWQGEVQNATRIDLSFFANFWVHSYYQYTTWSYYYGYGGYYWNGYQYVGPYYYYNNWYFPSTATAYATVNYTLQAVVDGETVDVATYSRGGSYTYLSYWARTVHNLPTRGTITQIQLQCSQPNGYSIYSGAWSNSSTAVGISSIPVAQSISIDTSGSSENYGLHAFMQAYRLDRAYDNLMYILSADTSAFNNIPTYVFSSGTEAGLIPLTGTGYPDLPNVTGFPGFTNQGGFWQTSFAQYSQGRNTLYCAYYFNTGGRGWESDFSVQGDLDMQVSIRPHTSFQVYHGLSIFTNTNYWNPAGTASGRISAVVYNDGTTGYLYLNGSTLGSNISWNTSVTTAWYTLRFQHNVSENTVTATLYTGEDSTTGTVVATTTISESYSSKYKIGLGGASPQTSNQNYAAYFYKFRSNKVGAVLSTDTHSSHVSIGGRATISGTQTYKYLPGDIFALDTNSTVYAAVPATSVTERNSLYLPDNGWNDNTPIVFTTTDSLSTVPEPLVSNVTYYTERVDSNRFRVRRTDNGDIVDLTTHGVGNVTVTGNILNPARNSMYSPGHSLQDGTELVYNAAGQTVVGGLSDGETYYVYGSTSSRFRVSQDPIQSTDNYDVQFDGAQNKLEIIQNLSQTFNVKVANDGTGDAFYIDGVRKDSLTMYINHSYTFDLSDSTNTGHPFRFSTTSPSPTQYNTGVTVGGTPGMTNAYVQINVTASTPTTLYYYCTTHGMAMGSSISVQTAPTPVLYRDVTYTFDMSSATLSGHEMLFRQSDPVIRSIGRSDAGGNTIGSPVTKDMTYGSVVIPAAGSPSGAQVTISGSYWPDWGSDVFDNWGFFYLYTPRNSVYTQFQLDVINQNDGVLTEQVISDNGRTFRIEHGYPVQGIYRLSITVEDNDTFVFGLAGDGPDGNNDADESVNITVGGTSYTLYKFRDTYSGDEAMYTYWVPYQSVTGRPYTRYESGDSHYLYSQPVKRGITVYVVKRYDVYPWVAYDLTTDSLSTSYTDGVSTVGTPGTTGSTVSIQVTDSTPNPLYFYCPNHANQGGSFVVQNPEVDLTGLGVGIQYLNVNLVGASDGTYFVSSVPSASTLVLDAPYNIPLRNFEFSLSNVSTTNNTVFIPDHRMPVGAKATYSINGDTGAIGGLVDGASYYIIRTDQHTIKLASSQSDARAGVAVSLTSVQSNGVDHKLTTASIGGEVISAATANVTTDSNIVVGDASSKFTNTFKIGDSFKIVYNGSTWTKKVKEVLSNSAIQTDTPYSFTGQVLPFFLTTGLYVKADGLSLHRPFDGGVELVASTNADAQIMRQTRKYFRYQSGKGIQVSLAVNFSAPTDLKNLSRVGEVATAETMRPHRLTTGVEIVIDGVSDSTWRGTYTIDSTPTATVFTFRLDADGLPNTLQAGGIPTFYVKQWVNSHLRAGLFDDQNGMFFEYDGQQLHACRRSSVRQLTGTVEVVFNSPIVVGTSTTFTSSLVIRDSIVIKGQTYRVVSISNDSLLYVQPVYRGKSQKNVVVTLTETSKVPQREFSIDPCDGTGAGGYNLDINSIQMAYIDYSWYGAGKIRFGFKNTHGEVRYVHEFVHNNQLTEAYMRSGNLPCRYEIENTGVPSYVPSLLHWGTSVIMDGTFHDDKAYLFTASGKVLSYDNGDTSRSFTASSDQQVTELRRYPYYYRGRVYYRYEEVTYWPTYSVYNPSSQQTETAYLLIGTSFAAVDDLRSGTILTGTYLNEDTRIVTITNSNGAANIYVTKQPTQEFTAETIQLGSVSTGTDILPVIPLISIRLAPSADNSRPGLLGDREVVNRMQMQLKTVGILATNDTEIRLMLNSSIDNREWQRSTAPSLSQLVVHEKGDLLEGGTQIFNFRVPGGTKDATGTRNAASTDLVLTDLVDLGNSILGGDSIFPNGPDLLTIAAAVIDTTGISASNPYVITARITWSESQA